MTMCIRHRRTYHALVEYGFSASNALDIVIHAQRGDAHALLLCKTVLSIVACS